MQLSEYEFRYVLGLVLAVCLIRYFIYSWTLSVIKKSDAFDAEEENPSDSANCTQQENEQLTEEPPKQIYQQLALIAGLLTVATALLFLGS